MSLSFLISEAFAQTNAVAVPAAGTAAPAAPGSGNEAALMQFVPLILIFAVFYFVLIRPQQKRFEQHKSMLEGLRRGDRVVTGGGIIGTIVKTEGNDEVVVEISDNVKVRVQKSSITTVLAKPEPQSDGKDDDKAK